MEYLLIKDTQSDKSPQILRESPSDPYIVFEDRLEPTVVRAKSIKRTMRSWMRELNEQPRA